MPYYNNFNYLNKGLMIFNDYLFYVREDAKANVRILTLSEAQPRGLHDISMR